MTYFEWYMCLFFFPLAYISGMWGGFSQELPTLPSQQNTSPATEFLWLKIWGHILNHPQAVVGSCSVFFSTLVTDHSPPSFTLVQSSTMRYEQLYINLSFFFGFCFCYFFFLMCFFTVSVRWGLFSIKSNILVTTLRFIYGRFIHCKIDERWSEV